MALGEKLTALRKKERMSQETVAEKLKVSRQTVSKWETNQSTPELPKAQALCTLFNVSYDYLFNSNGLLGSDLTSIENIVDEIDWTKAWSTKYPILASYQSKDAISQYYHEVYDIYMRIKDVYQFSEQDALLVVKDMVYQIYKTNKARDKQQKKG